MSSPTSLPYFDILLRLLEQGDPVLERTLGHHVHWGYWPEPAKADRSPEDFASATEALTRLVYEAAGVVDGMKILDAGCGFGGTAASLNEGFSGVEIAGLNIDWRQLDRARNRLAPRPGNALGWVQADACVLPFPDAGFDAVLAVECIFHFPNRGQFFREAFRVLKPGGRLALSDFVPIRVFEPFMRAAATSSYGSGFYGCNHYCTLRDYRRLAAKTGFRLSHERDITANTLPTYDFMRGLAKHFAPESTSSRRETLFVEWVSRLRLLRYRVLGFEKPGSGA